METSVLPTATAILKLGMGVADITPPADAYHRNWGAALHDAAEGIHRALQATALVVRSLQGGPEHLLVALDLGWLRTREVKALLGQLVERTGIDRERLLVTFSHTHAAINLDVTRSEEPGGQHIKPYLQALPDRIVMAVEQARRDLRQTTITFGQGHCSLAMNRDFLDPEDRTFACGPNPAAPADDAVWIARLTGNSGSTEALLVNYACHPTTLAWENRLISPDYPGAMRALVEESTGARCAFLLGPCGDLGPRDGFTGDPAVADSNGRQLGYAVLSVREGLAPAGTQMEYTGKVVSGATLGIWRHVPVPAQRHPRIGTFRTAELQIELQFRELPTREELERRVATWRTREAEAKQAGDQSALRDCRARIERVRRAMRRLEELPGEGQGPARYRIALWQLGEGVLVGVGGEPYNLLQRELRDRLPGTPILFAVLSNEPYSYILPRDLYGSGRYQDESSTLAPGSLERIMEAIEAQLRTWGCR